VHHPEVTAGPNDRVEPASRITQIIAQNMVLSRRISPHVHSYFEVDYSRIDQLRRQSKRAWEEQGVKITYTHFIAGRWRGRCASTPRSTPATATTR
jgi:pyruvate dehydrogenase E2 component (dihydrolipoamide acetyltransferase)